MVAVVWNFETLPDQGDEFERFYGADGEWTKLSRRSRSFLGSSFLKDIARPERYVLVEYWSEMLVYEKHLADFDDELHRLEEQRQRFVERMEAIGVFTALDVPDRWAPPGRAARVSGDRRDGSNSPMPPRRHGSPVTCPHDSTSFDTARPR